MSYRIRPFIPKELFADADYLSILERPGETDADSIHSVRHPLTYTHTPFIWLLFLLWVIFSTELGVSPNKVPPPKSCDAIVTNWHHGEQNTFAWENKGQDSMTISPLGRFVRLNQEPPYFKHVLRRRRVKRKSQIKSWIMCNVLPRVITLIWKDGS